MAWATVSGVPTSALELPAPPVTAAVRVHSARSNRSPSPAISISRCEPVFSGLPIGRRDDRPERDLDPGLVGPPGRRGRGAHGLDLLRGPGQRLAPQAVDVG